MRYPEFRDRLERVLQDAGLFAFGFNRTETIDLANASRHWKFYMMSGARQKAEPFHISAEIARQVEMARSLGMNPKKLPSLRPSPDQRWKLPVGKFIESCYGKRFGGDAHEHPRLDPESRSSKPAAPKPDLDRSKASGDTMSQLEDLVVYFANLVTDLEAWLIHGAVSPKVVAQLISELRKVVAKLETGDSILPFPEIPRPPHPGRLRSSRQVYRKQEYDDEIPF